MVDHIKNCVKHAHLIPQLETIDNGRLIDIIELKLELYCAAMEIKYKGKSTTSDTLDNTHAEHELQELETWGTAILLRDKIMQYKELLENDNGDKNIEDLKIEIIKMIYDII